jgi:hypothetical protein
MVLYRFYRITSTVGDECYIGSTTLTLSTRFSRHKTGHKLGRKISSTILFDKYGVETCSITLIHEQEMEKVDALRQERRLIEECPMAVNKLRPIREKEEEKEYNRKYNQEHNEEVREWHRIYYEEHCEEVKEQQKKYREEHRDTIAAKQREKIQCDVCGKSITRANMAQHKKRKACQAFQ